MLDVFLGSLFGSMLGSDNSSSNGISLKDFNLSEEFYAPTLKKSQEKSFFIMINLHDLRDKIIEDNDKEIIVLRVYLKEMWKNEYPIHLCEVMYKADYEKIKEDLEIGYSPLFFNITDKDGFILTLSKKHFLKYPIIVNDKEADIIQIRDQRLWTDNENYEVVLCEAKYINK
ncbi:hypothetical protein [Clostridium saccharoperbutylacetonicum]|uniref:hypothetical protein n=1 Tax=Clostridium saccharoperbutylacetonicum TaxID=36745 RepID=UPI0039ED63C6